MKITVRTSILLLLTFIHLERIHAQHLMCFLLKYAKLYAYYTLLTTAMSCYFLLVTLPLLQHLLMVPVGITKLFLRKITCCHAEAQLFLFLFLVHIAQMVIHAPWKGSRSHERSYGSLTHTGREGFRPAVLPRFLSHS